uniref:Uncharacterized protein n=1 Tax=Romanomermis culicivorax TaxID=13658 RepID=A0A915HSZ8_ROMCU
MIWSIKIHAQIFYITYGSECFVTIVIFQSRIVVHCFHSESIKSGRFAVQLPGNVDFTIDGTDFEWEIFIRRMPEIGRLFQFFPMTVSGPIGRIIRRQKISNRAERTGIQIESFQALTVNNKDLGAKFSGIESFRSRSAISWSSSIKLGLLSLTSSKTTRTLA